MIRFSEFLVIALVFVPTVWSVSEALRFSEKSWQASDQNQVAWVVVILLAPILGPFLYFLIARPRLRAL